MVRTDHAVRGVRRLWIFPRAFYGKAASRALDEAPAAPDSLQVQPWHHGLNPDMADIGNPANDFAQGFEAKRAAARGEFNVV